MRSKGVLTVGKIPACQKCRNRFEPLVGSAAYVSIKRVLDSEALKRDRQAGRSMRELARLHGVSIRSLYRRLGR